jgi:murein DD-endopeptidase MepM/ murein hydrolase activator NlpD
MSHLFLRTTFLLTCLLLISAAPRSESSPDDPQKLVDVVDEKSTSITISLIAINKVDYPVTVNVDLPTLDNLKAVAKGPYTVVVQPKKRTLITKLTKINPRKATRYATTYSCYAGWRDPKQAEFVYTLPWGPGFAYRIGQGFNGKFSHQGKNALDFNIPDGGTICAARGGMVIEVTQNFSEGGIKEEFKDKANRILILHDDGSLGRYAHLQHNGAKVKVGQRVKTGDAIGLCGATGYAQGPHLHFEVDCPPAPGGENQYETIPIDFFAVDENGKEARIAPKEGTTLQRPDGTGSTKPPANLIEEIVLCRKLDDAGKPVNATDIFRGDEAMTILLRIGAPGDRNLKLIVSRAGDDKSAPLFQQTVATKSSAGGFSLTIDLAKLPNLRGSLTLRVLVNDQSIAEKNFRVQ